MLGYAICASHCTFEKSFRAMEELIKEGYELQPIMSENAYKIDTRFGRAAEWRERIEELCKNKIIHTVPDAEPLGPSKPLDALIIAPCTGNTLAKIANGITDTSVTMAAKAHLRRDRMTLIALATNDGTSQNLASIAKLITRRSVYFVRMIQDDPIGKPHSLVADMSEIPTALREAFAQRQMRPIFRENTALAK